MRDPTPCWYKVKNKYERKVQTKEHYFLSVFSSILYLNLCSFSFLFSCFLAPDRLLFLFFFILFSFVYHSTYISISHSTPLYLLSVHLPRPGGFLVVLSFLHLYLALSFSFVTSPSHSFSFVLSSSVHYPTL